jgi:hypothetical protein
MFSVFDTISLVCRDRAPLRPVEMSPLVWRGATHGGAGLSYIAGDDDTDLDEVEESLTQLTIFVPLTKDEDIPICMRRDRGFNPTWRI